MLKKSLAILVLSLSVFGFTALSAQAQNLNDAFKTSDASRMDNTAKEAGFKTGADVSIYKNISDIIKVALSFLGVLFIMLMIYAGWLWMTARGEEAQVEKAKNIIITAIIGIIIVISSYAISWFVINALSKKTILGG